MSPTRKKLEENDGGTVAKWALSANAWRISIVILVASQHPIGRQLLGTFGFEFPDQRKLTVAAEEAKSAKVDLNQLVESVRDLKSDMANIKSNNSIIQTKVDRLDQAFTGFQIDFNKWKPKDTQP